MLTLEAKIYSPRWGHDDVYKLEFDRAKLRVFRTPREAICVWRDGQDPEWKGESLERILSNDGIYVPAIFQWLVEHLWTAWRNGELDQRAVDVELQMLIAWLNAITEAKPKTDFWRKLF